SILSGHCVRAMSQKRHSFGLGTLKAGNDTQKNSRASINFGSTASGGMPTLNRCRRRSPRVVSLRTPEGPGEEGEEIESVTPGFHFHRQLFRLQAEPRANGESAPPLPAEGSVPPRWPPSP